MAWLRNSSTSSTSSSPSDRWVISRTEAAPATANTPRISASGAGGSRWAVGCPARAAAAPSAARGRRRAADAHLPDGARPARLRGCQARRERTDPVPDAPEPQDLLELRVGRVGACEPHVVARPVWRPRSSGGRRPETARGGRGRLIVNAPRGARDRNGPARRQAHIDLRDAPAAASSSARMGRGWQYCVAAEKLMESAIEPTVEMRPPRLRMTMKIVVGLGVFWVVLQLLGVDVRGSTTFGTRSGRSGSTTRATSSPPPRSVWP
jgi:hypothetical protein